MVPPAVEQPLATHHNDLDAEHDIQPPKTPDYRPNGDDYELNDQEMSELMEEYEEGDSPPPSQPRPVRQTQYPPKRERENSPPRQDHRKRGQKRKYTGTNAVEAKIAKTAESIDKLEKHLANRTCPKSL